MNRLSTAMFVIASLTISIAGLPGCGEVQLAGELDEGADGAARLTGEEPPGTQVDPPAVTAGAAACQKKGMTWKWKSRTNDVDSVGSDPLTNPYSGDTTCNNSLPILCIRKVGAPQPPYITTSFYYGWSGGYIALTKAHLGYNMTSAAAADAICASELGAGWEMAEFHDGNGGSNFQAYGAATHISRFWTMINDQLANCWNSPCQ